MKGPDPGFEETFEVGKRFMNALIYSPELRKNLSKWFKGIDYSPDAGIVYPDMLERKFQEKGGGKYFLKYKLKGWLGEKVLVVPIDGVARAWYRVYVIPLPQEAGKIKKMKEIFDKDRKYRTKEEKRILEDYRKHFDTYVKNKIEGKI